MAISYVSGTTAQKAGSNNNTYLTIDISGFGLAEGDLVIAVSAKAHSAAGSVNMISSGWTAITGSPVASTNSAFSAYYKFMGSTPDTQVQFDDSNSGSWAQTAFVRAYRGVDATTPFDVTPTTDTGIDTANYNAPSITPSTAGAWIVAFGCGAGTACAAYSTPGDLSDFASVTQADSADSVIGVGQKTDWSSGAFDPAAVTGSTNAVGYTWAAMTMALRPAATAQELDAATGSFSLTGTAATFLLTSILSATTGSFAVTGQAAELDRALIQELNTGAFTLAGSAASFPESVRLQASAGSLSLTGGAASLVSAEILAASAGALTLSGQALSIITAGKISAEAAAFTLTGSSASLTEAALLAASAGAISLTGMAATLTEAALLEAGLGTFTLTGNAATLFEASQLEATAGSFSLSGQAMTPLTAGDLAFAAGVFAVTGAAADLLITELLLAEAGAFAITGSALSVLETEILLTASASFTLTGVAANLAIGGLSERLVGTSGTTSATLSASYTKVLASSGPTQATSITGRTKA